MEIVLPNFPLIVLLPRHGEGQKGKLVGVGVGGGGILFPFKLPAVLPISEGGAVAVAAAGFHFVLICKWSLNSALHLK